MINSKKRILVLGPHTDDGEFGCGASISKWINEGHELIYAIFSICEESVPEGFEKDILKYESLKSSKILGIKENNLIFYNFPVRRFQQFRQDILEEMVKLRKELEPDIVLLPSKQDLHQDHATISIEGWRAFKSKSILGYEIIWNNLTFPTHFFNEVSKADLDKKILAIKQYESQNFRSYSKESFIRSLAEVRGTQIDRNFAESFEVMRWIL